MSIGVSPYYSQVGNGGWDVKFAGVEPTIFFPPVICQSSWLSLKVEKPPS